MHEYTLFSDIQRIKKSGVLYTLFLWFTTTGYKLFDVFSKKKSMESTADLNNIPIYKTNNINNEEIANTIRTLQPDILLCAHFNQLISPSVYSLASEAALNIHPSLLPDLKGVDPGFYALLDNYQCTGVTLHELAEKFDEGIIITQKKHNINESDTLLSLNKSLFTLGSELLIGYLQNSVRNTHKTKEDNKQSRYDSWPTKEQVKTMRKKRRLISLRDIKQLFHDR